MTCNTVDARSAAPESGRAVEVDVIDHDLLASVVARMVTVAPKVDNPAWLSIFLGDCLLAGSIVRAGWDADDCTEIVWRVWCGQTGGAE